MQARIRLAASQHIGQNHRKNSEVLAGRAESAQQFHI
jgi:hypothetical protein